MCSTIADVKRFYTHWPTAVWHSLSASTHPPTHVFLSFLRPGGSISKARGGVGTGCNIVRLREQQQRRHRQGKTHALSTALLEERAQTYPFHHQARQTRTAYHSIFQQLSRSTLNMPHSIYTKIVCRTIRLPVATAVWRTVIHCY